MEVNVGLWKSKIEGIVTLLNFVVGENSWDYCERKNNNTQWINNNKIQVLITGTNDQAPLFYLGHIMWRLSSLEKTLILEKMKGREEEDDQY